MFQIVFVHSQEGKGGGINPLGVGGGIKKQKQKKDKGLILKMC